MLLHLGDVLQQFQPLDVSGVHISLEGSGLRLLVKDPLHVVASLQLQLEHPGTKPVVLLLSLEESEALLLVSRCETVPSEGPIRRTREEGVNGSRYKFFSKEMRTPTRRTRLPNHFSDSTTQVGHDHAATGVQLELGTSNHLHGLENAGSVAGVGQFSHWPHPDGGASLSGISTTATQSPTVGAGAGGTVDVAVAAVLTAAPCRDPADMSVPCGGSVVAAALPSARGSLGERRLVGTDTSDLSALAGTRVGTVGATLPTETQD
jgi:hypothetical protein